MKYGDFSLSHVNDVNLYSLSDLSSPLAYVGISFVAEIYRLYIYHRARITCSTFFEYVSELYLSQL